ncbi:hypothetical protein BGZ52_012131, partial [Haplosporangium bisporale]
MYAYGMVLWEMAANCTVPYKDLHDDDLVALCVIDGKREKLPDNTPDEYHQWVKQCWAHHPGSRPEAYDVVMIEPTPLVREDNSSFDANESYLSFGPSDGISSIWADSTEAESLENNLRQ